MFIEYLQDRKGAWRRNEHVSAEERWIYRNQQQQNTLNLSGTLSDWGTPHLL